MIGIYMIRNKINNKKYIGQAVNIISRWRNGHLLPLRKKKHHNDHLQKSWNKYGEENFELLILKIFENHKQDLLDKYEKYFIAYYKTINSQYGYNKNDGGHNGKHNDEILKKISEKISHKLLTTEQANEVISMLISGKSEQEIANTFNINRRLVRAIKFNKTYRFINRKGYVPKEKMKTREHLKEDKVLSILKDYENGVYIKDILNKHSISRKVFDNIRNNKTYLNVDRRGFNTKKRKINKKYNELDENLVIKILNSLSNSERMNDICIEFNVKYNDVKLLKENKIFTHISRENFNIPLFARNKSGYRFSDDEVKDILKRLQNGEKIIDICKIYGKNSANTISKIKNGIAYKHIKRD
ncbi:homing endonuclease [Bacillus phage G]|uniref:Gp355 n=1 Tax=Bacillus phage G TaxID=2884420 RepID=G3MA96_9CAUD|nr:homing endonuclease [Bacillus phage G]AEO93614.1 gp355 [Bacillus phage G]